MKWASKTKDKNQSKKLWLQIAKKNIELSEEKLINLLNNKKCPLKISDVIVFFDEDYKISSF